MELNNDKVEPVSVSRKPWLLTGIHFSFSTPPCLQFQWCTWSVGKNWHPSSWPSCWKARRKIQKECNFHRPGCCLCQEAEPADKPQRVWAAIKPPALLQTSESAKQDAAASLLSSKAHENCLTLTLNCVEKGILENTVWSYLNWYYANPPQYNFKLPSLNC